MDLLYEKLYSALLIRRFLHIVNCIVNTSFFKAMTEEKRNITFMVEKQTKRPVLYAPKRIKIEPGHMVSVPMNFKIILPEHIIGRYTILSYLAKQEIKLMDYNTYQRTTINFFNQNHIKTVTIRKREPIGNFITFNEGTENFNVKRKKF